MSEHTLDRMVAGLIKTAGLKLAEESSVEQPEQVKTASASPRSVDDEAEKTASALEYLASCIEEGQLSEEATDLERIKQAYDIVSAVEADPKLKFKIVTAMQEIPKSTGEAPSISPGMAGSAMKHDLASQPGGKKQQQQAKANASGYATPKNTDNPASSEHTGPGLMTNDLDKVPGGGGAYPEAGPIRDASVKSAFAMGRALRKQAEFSVNSSKGDGKAAKITGKAGGGPLGKPDGASQAGENVPKRPSPSDVASNRAAIDYTKRDAKTEFVKKEVGKVLDAPILDKGSDDVLEKNLTHTEVSKLASLARKELTERALRGSVQPDVKEAAWGGAGTAMALDPNGPSVGNWARGTAAGLGGGMAGSLAGTAGGGVAGGGIGAALGGLGGALVGRAGAGARMGGMIGGGLGATAGALGGSFLGGRAGIEATTRGDAQAQGLTPEQHRDVVHQGMLGGFGGQLAGNIVPGAGMVAAPALSHLTAKNRLQQIQGVKQAGLDRGGFQTEDKDLDDRRLEQEAAFRESLQDAARASGESMQGVKSMTGMPNSGSAITPSIPGY